MRHAKSSLGLIVALAILAQGLAAARLEAQSDLGEVATELIDCFGNAGLGLNDLLGASIEPGPNEPYQSALVEVHRLGSLSSSSTLRRGVRNLPRFGTLTQRSNLSRFEQIVDNSLILEQCGVVLALLDDPMADDAAKMNAASKLVDNVRALLVQGIEIMEDSLAEWIVPQFDVLSSIEDTISGP